MTKLDNFVDMMTGHFDNKEQFEAMKEAGKIYPVSYTHLRAHET